MRKLLPFMLAFLLLFTTGCQSKPPAVGQEQVPLTPERVEELYALSQQFTEYLNTNNINAAMEMMDETVSDAMDGKMESTWKQLCDSMGGFIKTGSYVGSSSQGYDAIEMTLSFNKGNMIQRIVFDSDNLISGLWFRNGEVDPAIELKLPEGVKESDVTVDAGEDYALPGKLTLPENGTPVAAVVLIHGSGPNDMNETIGTNNPFKDLAYGLAQNGIAVLRYDKRSYTYGAALAEQGSEISIDEEVASDALAAVKLLKSRDDINSDNIYLLGHSMGAGLLSYINSKGADCAGYIVMAGSPRSLWELSADQNLLIADEMEQSGDNKQAEEIREFVRNERIRAEGLADLKGDETVFGMPASYLQSLGKIDTISLHMNDGLPMLVLQGEKDRQVSMKDFTLWQEGLSTHPKATFASFPTLNHLFGEYVGNPVLFSKIVDVEYAQKTPVSDEIITAITNWING